MAQSILGSVGINGRNTASDVTVVQSLLNSIPAAQGGPTVKLVVDGRTGPKTNGAIQRFQTKHFGAAGADGRVDPGKQTFNKLLALQATIPDGNFQGFSAGQIQSLKQDLARAQTMIDNAVSLMAIAPFLKEDANVIKMVLFNFGVDFTDKSNPIAFALQSTLLLQVQGRFTALRTSLVPTLPFVLEAAPPPGSFAADAFVVGADPTIHVMPQYFGRPADERSAILAHERAHTLFAVTGHPGMGGGLAVLVVGPKDDKRPFFTPKGKFLDQSLSNPFCYEWLMLALDNGASARVFNPGCLCATAP